MSARRRAALKSYNIFQNMFEFRLKTQKTEEILFECLKTTSSLKHNLIPENTVEMWNLGPWNTALNF